MWGVRFWGGLLGPGPFMSERAVTKPNTARAAEHSWRGTRRSPRASVCWCTVAPRARFVLHALLRVVQAPDVCGLKPARFLPLQHGWTPLHVAADKGDKAAAELLLKHGADADARTKACGVCGLGAGLGAPARL